MRFLDVVSGKGYAVATMAKRSFCYPTRIPRPNLTDLAMDVVYFIERLKMSGLLATERDLVIVGYSEGSVVATKVLGMLREKPYACILLGSASMCHNCESGSIEDFPMTDVLRRIKNWSDDQIAVEYDQLCRIQKEMLNMDEEKFESEYKNSKPFGFGFAMWESFHIDRELFFYDPVPGLLSANVPVLICVGGDDTAMPVTSAGNIYERLSEGGLEVTFRSIEKESHQYEKYDVFALMDAWLTSGRRSTDYALNGTDSLIIEKYAKARELTGEIWAIPYGGGFPERVLKCYHNAVENTLPDAHAWYTLGLKLFADGYLDEAYNSFARATDSTFVIRFASLVWMGHIKDLDNQRDQALAFYQQALDAYPGFPVQHDNWNMIIDKTWIEERFRTPFPGIKK